MNSEAFNKYFKALRSKRLDDVTEHSHRTHLENLLLSVIEETDNKIKILHEPKRQGRLGPPDFKVTRVDSIIGYIENKELIADLKKNLKSEQIKKYKELSNNILLTNYIDWIWIRDGKDGKCVSLCSIDDIKNLHADLDNEKAEAVDKLIKSFLSQPPMGIADAKKLAVALATRAKLLKDILFVDLEREKEEQTEGRLYQLYETFKTFVFHELNVSEFSDAFAQNLVYGLFLAKLNADTKTIDLYNAKQFIPQSFELIRELVNFLDELDDNKYIETKWIVEEVLSIMNNLDLRAINDSLSFTKRRKDSENIPIKDPYVYFYEDFLAAYDKKLRKAKGVYYTPPPVVNFIVRAIDDILVDTFGIKEGLADRHRVTVLDFAAGTGTFLIEVFQRIFDKLPRGSGKKDILIKEHILKNLYGFEYLIAPYTIAHLKLSQFLKDNGYELQSKERLQIFLTNTLEPIDKQVRIPLLPALTTESRQAQKVKDTPILVITGNPPYSGHSKNNGDWIKAKIEDYKMVDRQKLKEKNPKWLQDDYVKFIRFAQDKMDKVDEGIVGIVTNHRFLTNPTFRGMRQSLMNTFNQLYFIDLHGSNKPKEVNPNGGKDENVFDIEQGVAISLFIKKKGLEKKIFHTDFWGTRVEKYIHCLEEETRNIEWDEVKASKPFYLFKPQNEGLKKEYVNYWNVKDIFILNSNGIITKRDNLVIASTDKELKSKLEIFNDPSRSDNSVAEYFGIPLKDKDKWNLTEARQHLKVTGINQSKFVEILYRPFDKRTLYFDEILVARLVKNVMFHLQEENMAIICGRAGINVSGNEWNLITVAESPTDLNLFSRGGGTTFPLYILRNGIEKIFFQANEVNEPTVKYGKAQNEYTKEENFTKEFRNKIDKKYGEHFSPEEIFGYLYSILHSPTYRRKYTEFLESDFPRIPFTDDKRIFKTLAKFGNELIQVHLLNPEGISKLDASFGDYIGTNNHIVEKPVWEKEGKSGKLFINNTHFFAHVPEEIYEFYIGGYQVLDKYLKDRKGGDIGKEVEHIEQVIQAIAFTIGQMKKIDSQTKNWI